MKILRLFHTIKYLKPIQIWFQIKYRLRNKKRLIRKIQNKKISNLQTNNLNFDDWIDKPKSYDNSCFSFLNQSHCFENEINWDFSKYGKLWTYNLNYMDYLLQEGMSKELGYKLINEFISGYDNNENGKEPYPISLRGINWIKFLSKHSIEDDKINKFLYLQYVLLTHSIEYHLLGNHLLENGFSLLFGAYYFNSKKFLRIAKRIISKQLKEQILSDGAHFELSPMYHQIILDRLLDSINLIANNKVFKNQKEFQELLSTKANMMLSWLSNITFSNGEIPHFNDSTNNIAPTTKQLLNYATLLNLPVRRSFSKGGNLNLNLPLSSSGYRRFNHSGFELIADVGKPGPEYIPGHAHADMLSFVLNYKNKPIIVDTGISTYEKNLKRQNERSTFAHNTVVVNNTNQSDVWGGFRLGKRAKIEIVEDTENYLKAKHNGFKPFVHTRSFSIKEKQILIEDSIGGFPQLTECFLHFHPDRVISNQNGNLIIDNNISVEFKGNKGLEILVYDYPLGYNKFIKATRCKLSFDSKLNTKIEVNEN